MGKIEKSLRVMLGLWGLYLLFEASLYFFNIRLSDVRDVWPESSIAYVNLIEKILGSVIVLVALFIFEILRHLDKYRTILKLGAIWTLFHGSLLIFLGLSQNYVNTFSNYPSLFVWFPYYNTYVILEGIAFFAFSILVYIWLKK